MNDIDYYQFKLITLMVTIEEYEKCIKILEIKNKYLRRKVRQLRDEVDDVLLF